jgi:hypothetical protein
MALQQAGRHGAPANQGTAEWPRNPQLFGGGTGLPCVTRQQANTRLYLNSLAEAATGPICDAPKGELRLGRHGGPCGLSDLSGPLVSLSGALTDNLIQMTRPDASCTVLPDFHLTSTRTRC